MTEIEVLQARINSLNEVLVAFEVENKKLITLNNVLIAEKKQWLQEKTIQTEVMTQQLIGNTETIQKLQTEICDLRKKHNDYKLGN